MRSNPIKIIVILAAVILSAAGFIPNSKICKPGRQTPADGKKPAYPCFLAMSDIHLCDDCKQAEISNSEANTGNDLWAIAKSKLQQVLSGPDKPQFIILLGDLPQHKADAGTKKRVIGEVLRDVRLLAQDADIPAMYVPGNNDAPDENYSLFSESIYADDADCKNCWPLIKAKNGKGEPATIIADSKSKLGYYAAYPAGKGLRVIAMNTVLFTHKYFKMDDNATALAAKELAWLDAQLDQANNAGEKVLICMHVPPGVDYQGKPMWQEVEVPKTNGLSIKDDFLQIVARHAAIITGILTSHTHMDGIKVFYDAQNKPVEAGISIPAIAPGHGNYPAFNLVYYSPSNFDLEDFKTCFYSYEGGQTPANWANGHFYLDNLAGSAQGQSMKQRLIQLASDPARLSALEDSLYSLANQNDHKHVHDNTVDVKY